MLTESNKYKDFIIPTLQALESLGGSATTRELQDRFYELFSELLDPVVDWGEIKKNHGKERWRDDCTTRVASHHLFPKCYVISTKGGSRYSTYTITVKGRERLLKG